MTTDARRASSGPDRRSPRGRRLSLAVAAIVLALLLAAAIPVSALPSGKAEAERLHSTLARMAKLANRRLRTQNASTAWANRRAPPRNS
jgi:type II secretory pathway pseudopilin PulG